MLVINEQIFRYVEQVALMELLEYSVVRVFFRNSNDVAGAGFLISKKHIITCAHVVIASLGGDRGSSSPPSQVRIQFPFLSGSTQLETKVVLWSPPSTENNDDIAVLELLQDIPHEALPARLIELEKGWSQDFKAYGFPDGYPNGIWATGFLRGKVANGRIQIDDLRQTGYFIEPGFSGTAIWNESLGGVVGMVVSADADRSTRTAFMIPTQRLKEFIGDSLPDFRIVYHLPTPKKEKLLTNLLAVESFAEHIYVATATKKKAQEVIDTLREHGFEGDEWSLKGGNITSFYNLDDSHWKSVCDQGTVEVFGTNEWAYSTDEDRQREFVYLLNKCLKSKVRADLWFFRDKEYYFFKASPDLKPRVYSYHSGKQKTERRVFTPYGKLPDGKPYYYRHSAFTGHFRRYDDVWYLEITPTYHFTSNGYELHYKYEDFIKKIKQLERNQAVMGQVRMWAYYLTQPPDMITPKYPFITFGQLIPLDADFGINDDEWLTHEESNGTGTQSTEDTPLF